MRLLSPVDPNEKNRLNEAMEIQTPRHVVFLDVDGTIAPLDAPIPQSAIDAIRIARQNGHKVFLCTGRSRAELQPNVMAIGFDGMVGCAGAFVDREGEQLFSAKLDDSSVAEIIEYFDRKHIHGFFQTPAVTYARKASLDLFATLTKTDGDGFVIPGIVAKENLFECHDVTKIFFISNDTPVKEIRKHFANRFMVIHNTIGLEEELSGELSQLGITKATGMEVVLKHYQLDRTHSIAVGDGYNDLEMIEYAGVGIAMGNAVDSLKQLADYVTDDIHVDGLAKAFKHMHLID